MRCPAGKAGFPFGRDMDELEPLREDGAVSGFDLVGDQEKERWFRPIVGRVHEDGTLSHEIAVLLQDDVADGKHEWMTGMHHLSKGGVRLVERADGFLGEADALIAFQDGGEFAAVAPADLAVALADKSGDVGDFETAGFTGLHASV